MTQRLNARSGIIGQGQGGMVKYLDSIRPLIKTTREGLARGGFNDPPCDPVRVYHWDRR